MDIIFSLLHSTYVSLSDIKQFYQLIIWQKLKRGILVIFLYREEEKKLVFDGNWLLRFSQEQFFFLSFFFEATKIKENIIQVSGVNIKIILILEVFLNGIEGKFHAKASAVTKICYKEI